MQQTLGNTIRKAGLGLAAMVACGMTFGTNALACNGPKTPAMGAPLSAKMASLRSMGLVTPPRLGAREQPSAVDTTLPQADALNPTIVGLWQVMDLEDGKPVGLSFEIWHADGTEVLIDQTPPAEGNVCIGTWLQSGPLTYKLTHPALSFDRNGNFIGTVMIREVVTLDRNGYKFTGTASIDIFDIDGTLQNHFDGQFVGTRISAL